METIKIYISLKEAENLIFNRSLIFTKNRVDIKKAQGLLSVNISIEKDKLIEFKNNYLILFSAILYFEIPEKDKNLFLNHYKVPLGLLEFSPRNVRDTPVEQNLFEDEALEYNTKNYTILRNGFLGVYSFANNNIANSELKFSAQKVLNEFNSLSDFRKKMLSELFEHSKFPTLVIKIDKFVTDNFFRIIWWGKFIGDNYLTKYDNIIPDEIAAVKKWLKVFLEFDDLEGINQQLMEIPDVLKDEMDFLLGYYFGAVNFESFQSEKDFLEKLNSKIKYENNNSLLCWISFFKSLFDEKIVFQYFIKPLNNEVFKIEKLAFDLANNNLENLHNDTLNFEFKEIDHKELISHYIELKEGGTNHNPQIINFEDAKNIFINNLSEESLKTNGFELKSEYENNKSYVNSCWFSQKNFHLKINSEVNISDIVFFVDKDSKVNDILKSLKFKVKPYSKLIDKNKKVLLGFLNFNETPNMCSIYSSLFNGEQGKQFERLIFVLLVDLDTEKIQSLEFDNYRKDQEKELNRLFNKKIDLIVKNDRVNNDSEIKRNLKNVLKSYKTEQIEVIDENFDNKKAAWILDANTDYLIKNENVNYYSIFNIE